MISRMDMSLQQPVYLPRIKAITIPDELHVLHKVWLVCVFVCVFVCVEAACVFAASQGYYHTG